MKLRGSSFLGISMGDRAIACAEIAVNGAKRTVTRLATFTLPAELTLDKPQPVGEALAAFLRRENFSASRAVAGVPAKWLIALERDLPPAADEPARAMLRLQSERLAVSESGEMVFDFTGRTDPARPSKVLLVGVPRQRLGQVEQILESAGLSSLGVTSAALALAAAAAPGDAPMLLLGRHGAEVVWRQNQSPRMLRHVGSVSMNGHGPATIAPLAAELGRSLMMTRSAAPHDLLVWDGVGMSAAQVAELSERSGFTVRPTDALATLKLQAPPAAANGAASAESYAPALALALAAADRSTLPLDFTNSRLAPRRARRFGQLTTWAAAVAVALILGTIALYVHVQQRQSALTTLTAAHTKKEKELADAQAMVNRMNYVRSYFEARPPYLEAMREVTLAFRPDEQIWATGFSLRDNHKGQFQGKANDQQTVLAVLDRLRKNPKFGEVKLLDIRDAGVRTREIAFSASFNFTATE